jgi:CRP/FNR family transcriptional regulator, cyclic AMP receptor protein
VSAPAISAATAPNSGAPPVALLRVDTGLRSAIPPEERAFAERVVIVPRRELEPGPWSPAAAADDSAHPFGVVLLDGIVTHAVTLAGRCNAELFGPGDIVRPWSTRDSVLPCTARWTTSGATIAVLDERFLLAARRWPGLSTAIQERLAEQAERAAVRTAIVALPRVGQRVLAVFWQLAERWGVVRPDGVVIRLALTHSVIGQLVGAQRPTVSLALQDLADDGLLRRTGRSTWLLSHASLELLAGNDETARPGIDPSVHDGPRTLDHALPRPHPSSDLVPVDSHARG